MTKEEINEFILDRIHAVEKHETDINLSNSDGILLHLIPKNISTDNPADFHDNKILNKTKSTFRKFSNLDTSYKIVDKDLLGYTPDKMYYKCSGNGIIESFRSGIIRKDMPMLPYIVAEDFILEINKFLEAASEIHKTIYSSNPPYYFFVTLIGIKNQIVTSFVRNYQQQFPSTISEYTFDSIIMKDIDDKIQNEVLDEIHGELMNLPLPNVKK